MSSDAPEFSRRVPLARLGRDPFRQAIEATPRERAALAGRFGLLALDRLVAELALTRQLDGTIRLEAEFAADFIQECVVSLEPVPGTLAHRFALLYGAPGADDDEVVIAAGEEDIVFEPLSGDAIDIGEAVAQELSLALPDFPRDPEAVAETPAATPAEHPFAALARWRKS